MLRTDRFAEFGEGGGMAFPTQASSLPLHHLGASAKSDQGATGSGQLVAPFVLPPKLIEPMLNPFCASLTAAGPAQLIPQPALSMIWTEANWFANP